LVILANSITLALFDYSDRASNTYYNKILDILNIIYTVIYAVEALLKIIAYGFIFQKGAYLRDLWNAVDFVVVVLGYAIYI
jgi:voltage-dependent calcium channel L type alpha-1S